MSQENRDPCWPCPICGQPFAHLFGSYAKRLCAECEQLVADEQGRRLVLRDTARDSWSSYQAFYADTEEPYPGNQCWVRGVRCRFGAGKWDDLQVNVAAEVCGVPPPPPRRSKILGCLLGGALGDALGYPIEFEPLAIILERNHGLQPPRQLAFAQPPPALISDDTQLSLFTAEGIIAARRRQDRVAAWPLAMAEAYLRWYSTQQELSAEERAPWHAVLTGGWLLDEPRLHAARAPGTTCLASLQRMLDHGPADRLMRATKPSKGCGAVMRVAPIGIAAYTEEQAFDLGCQAGLLTHGHPSGFLPAGYCAVLVHHLVRDRPLPEALARADARLARADGREETELLLARARELARQGPPTPEVIESLGRGWVGHEALAIALLTALTADLHALEPIGEALWRAACHSGDSDSTASLAGNLLGAAHGLGRLPSSWLLELELADLIERTALDLFEAAYRADPPG